MHQSTSGPVGPNTIPGNLPVTFESLLKEFKPAIVSLTRKYPQKYEDDFYQEGSLALLDAMQKFIILPPMQEFRPYAVRAIKYRMIDFYRKNVKKSSTHEVELYVQTIDMDYDGNSDYISNFTAEPEFSTTTDFDLDYQIIFSESVMKANNFLPKEIKVFDLHMNKEFTVTEIAGELQISVGQASKLLARTKEKAEKLWTIHHS